MSQVQDVAGKASIVTANKGLAYFHKASMDPTGSFMAVCAPGGQTRIRIYKISPTSSQQDATQHSGVTFEYLCEASEPTASVVDVCWAHPSAGMLVAISCTDRCINVYKLKRHLDGTPVLERTGVTTSRAFTILAKEVVLAVAFPPVRRASLLLAMAMNNGDLAINSITVTEKREAYVQLDASSQSSASAAPVTKAAPSLTADAPRVDNRPAATAVAWCPSAAETSNVLVVGFANGVCIVAKIFEQTYQTLLRLDGAAHQGRAITAVAWAPPLGKQIQTIAYTSSSALSIAEFATQVDANRREGGYTITTVDLKGEVSVQMPGAAKISWSKDGGQLAVTCADNHTKVLSRINSYSPTWQVIAEL